MFEKKKVPTDHGAIPFSSYAVVFQFLRVRQKCRAERNTDRPPLSYWHTLSRVPCAASKPRPWPPSWISARSARTTRHTSIQEEGSMWKIRWINRDHCSPPRVSLRCFFFFFDGWSEARAYTRTCIHVVPPLSLFLSRATESHSRKRGTHGASRWYLFLNTCCASTTRHYEVPLRRYMEVSTM